MTAVTSWARGLGQSTRRSSWWNGARGNQCSRRSGGSTAISGANTASTLPVRNTSRRAPAAPFGSWGIAAVLVVQLSVARTTIAAELYLFPEIFSTEDNPLQHVGPASINASGQAAFFAEYADGSYSGILRGHVGTVEILANSTGPIRSFTSHPSINAGGDVAFSVTGDVPNASAVLRYTSAANSLDTIAESGSTFTFLLGASLHNGGAVAFGAVTATHELIAVGNGATTVFIDATSDPAVHFFGEVINRAGTTLEVAYVVDRPSSTTVLKGDSLNKTTIAETGPAFSLVRDFTSISNAGVVAFVARPVGGVDTLYTGTGGAPTVLANTLGDFTEFREVAVSNAGVAFRTHLAGAAGNHGVFTGPSVLNDKVIAKGDAIPGYPSTVDVVEIMPESMNDHGQIALRINFVDGTQRILRADPIGSLQQILEFNRATAALKTDSMSSMSQAVGTPDGDELLEFDYYFATAGGELTVMLEDEILARIPARDQLADGFTKVQIPVDVRALFPMPPDELMLKFTLAGTGETAGLLIDNVRFGDVENGDFARGNVSGWERQFGADGGVGVVASPFAIPEPAAWLIALVAAAVGSWHGARRRSYATSQAQRPGARHGR